MEWLSGLLHKVSHWFGRDRFEQDLEEELRLHREERASELMSAGRSASEAHSQAAREFGSASRITEEVRDAWRFAWLEDFVRDIRYCARTLVRDRAFTLTAILSLALGVAVNTTIFTIASSFLLSEPSVKAPETLFVLRLGPSNALPARELRFIRDSGAFDGVTGANPMQEANWRTSAGARRLFVTIVTSDFFDVTGTPVASGRPFRSGEHEAVVISEKLQRRMGGDVLGKTITLDGRTYTVVGVLPRVHRSLIGFGYSPDLYLPARADAGAFQLYVRTRDGQSPQAAVQRAAQLASDLDRIYPDRENKRASRVGLSSVTAIERLTDRIAITVTTFFLLLMSVSGLLLLVACANVASLVLARSASRTHELAVRLSIGASRQRLVRQLLAESLLLAVGGTIVGLVANYILTNLLESLQVAAPYPLILHFQPDTRLLMYSAGVAVATALITGLMPALQATRQAMSARLNSGGFQNTGSWTVRRSIIAGQVAVSVVVLMLAALSLRNLSEATRLDPGFDLQHTTWSQFRLVPENYPDVARVRALASAAVDRLRALPGVEAAAVASFVPLNDHFLSRSLTVYTTANPAGRRIEHSWNSIGPDYLRTLGIGLVAGREFLPSDREGSQRVLIVNEAFAQAAFRTANPVGQRVRFSRDPVNDRLIVGIARNSKYSTVGEKDRPAVYESYYQAGGRATMNLLIRGATAPAPKIVDNALLALDASAASETKLMTEATAFALMPSQIGAAMLGTFGVLGLLLASVGLYGVLAYSVNRRTREIGVRMALGAAPRAIMSLVLREAGGLVVIGLVIGAVIGLIVARPLQRFMVPTMTPMDPLAFFAVALALLLSAALATMRPIVRARRIDPLTALREQ